MEQTSQQLTQQWQDICPQIRQVCDDDVLDRWLGQMTPVLSSDGSIDLIVPTQFMKEWLNSRDYAKVIADIWRQSNPDLQNISFKTKTYQPETEARPLSVSEPALNKMAVSALPEQSAKPENLSLEVKNFLDPNMTFANFVVGKTNEFAYAAARRVADNAEISYNPLYLHSSVGLGKTHLMQAIAAEIEHQQNGRTVMYLSAEKFMFEFVKALRSDKTVDFRELFRSVDVFMIDDIQFICGKRGMQEEFFHTFNELVAQGKQIVLASDSSPLELKGLDDRLKTRMAQGLVADIYPTTYEMRIGILQTKAALYEVNLPNDVAEFLAEHITTNVRELEGALKRIVANSQLLNTPITLENTKQILRDLLHVYEKDLSIEDIQKSVAEYYNIKLIDLKSTRRDRRIARPRQIAMYLSKQLTTKSLPEIGLAFDRDHTTIIHAIRTIDDLMVSDADVASDVKHFIKNLKGA